MTTAKGGKKTAAASAGRGINGRPKTAPSTAASPPSSEECRDVLSSLLPLPHRGRDCDDDDDALDGWRGIVERCLSHGTEYRRMHRNGGSGGEEAEKEGMRRAEACGNVLADSLDWYLTRRREEKGGRGKDDDVDDDDDPVIRAVVEGLWLSGCILGSSSSTVTGNGDVGDDNGDESTHNSPYRRLSVVMKRLVGPRKDGNGDVAMGEGGGGTATTPTLVPIPSLQSTLELNHLEGVGLLPPAPPSANATTKTTTKRAPASAVVPSGPPPDTPASFASKRLKKMNTDMYYRQMKFNLLAEEGQGYAKLLTFLLVVGIDRDHDDEKDDEDARKRVRELMGSFDLDPNRVLDLTLDVLEWTLNEVVVASSNDASIEGGGNNNNATTPSSFSELAKVGNGASAGGASLASVVDGDEGGGGGGKVDGGWWGLDRIRYAMADRRRRRGEGGGGRANVRSLLAIVRELDGGGGEDEDDDNEDENGDGIQNSRRGGRAVAHLLGFKYRSYAARHAAAAAAADAASSSPTPAATVTASLPALGGDVVVYPRSLHLSVAYLCARGILDPHELIPHLVVAYASFCARATAVPSFTASTVVATSLMVAHGDHCVAAVERLRRLGVVSLNSSNSSAAKSDGDGRGGNNDQAPTVAHPSFENDAVVSIFRALLALGDDWDAAAAFLAHAAHGPRFAAEAIDGGGDDATVAGMRSAMDAAVSAACTLSEGVVSDLCAWVGNKIYGICEDTSQSNGNDAGGRVRDSSFPSSMETPLAKDETLAGISSVLLEPLSALARSGRIRAYQNLYIKLCRLYARKLTKINPGDIDDDTLSVLSTFLVPSMSLFQSDTVLPGELWAVLDNLPYQLRYKLYSVWRRPGLEKVSLRAMSAVDVRSGNIPKPLSNIESEIETGIAARYVLKRISKENIVVMGRKLAKTSHNNPLVVFTDILSKIESYDNMILMMVDTFQFATKLGLDVMGYCLLVSLGGGEDTGQKNRTKMGGLNTEQWLSSLETFTGAFYKKFPFVEMRGILMYITKRFKEGQASELGILRSLIKTVGGYGFVDYDSTASLSDLQLDGRRGSRLLKRETSSFGVVEDVNREASQQLRSVLQGGDLGVIILIFLSQIRSRVLYSKSSDTLKQHVKVIGNMYDDCEAVMCLLLEYLSDSSDDLTAKEKFAASMPSLSDLHYKYGVDTAVAWMLCRSLVKPKYLSLAASTPSSESLVLFPEAASKQITPTMFETFYSLAIYDISCPEERYCLDIERLKKDCDRLIQLQQGGEAARGQMSMLAAAAAAAGGNYDQIRQATAFTKTHAMQLDRLKSNVDQLSNDFQRQQKRCNLVLSKLEANRQSLIASEGDDSMNGSFASAFTTFCLYQRFLLSPEDALYCAHFVKLLHKIKVPGFPTIELIDNIVNAVIGSLYCVTEDEAGNLSIFLNEIWKSVNSWRYDNDAFASELKNWPGSRLSKDFLEKTGLDHHASSDGITHDDYKSLYNQWHQKIGSAAIGCLESAEYMHTRAALIVLSRIVSVFPTQPKIGERILKTLAPLQSEDNDRPDIRATAQGYCSQLIKARDEGMWKEENIAVTKARQEREKMKADEKKKKLAERHEEMKKETEMISRQLHEDGRDGWRQDRRDGRDERGRPWGMDPRHTRPILNPGAPSFTPKNRTEESRESHSRPADSRRSGMDREAWDRDRGSRQAESWDNQRPNGEPRAERRKRSRSPEPGEDTGRQTQKRTRGDVSWAPPPGGGGGGTRRSDRGGSGSSRY